MRIETYQEQKKEQKKLVCVCVCVCVRYVNLLYCTSDFGISRILDGQGSSVAGFKAHNLNGASISYASPEAIVRFRSGGEMDVGQPQVIKAGDVYSLAVVLCEMLLQKKPWSH